MIAKLFGFEGDFWPNLGASGIYNETREGFEITRVLICQKKRKKTQNNSLKSK